MALLSLSDRVRGRIAEARVLKMPADQLAALQLDALNRALDAAARTAPYRAYHRVDRLEDLRTFPVIDRAYLMSFDLTERISTPGVELTREPSTGTTGEPMMTTRSREESIHQALLFGRHRRAAGISRRARSLHLDFTQEPDAPLRVQGRTARLPGWAPVTTQVEAVRTFCPTVISSASSILLELADALGDDTVKLDVLATHGEFLSGSDREELSRAYQAEVMDLYSTSEVGHIAWQCGSRGSYHINADNVIVEILDDESRAVATGESGHVVLTALGRTSTPIIRYRVGDVGRLLPDACGCGIALPVMAQPEGRLVDCLIAYDGRRVSQMRFVLVGIGSYHDRVRRWRLIQRSVGDLLVEMVFNGEPIPGLADQMREAWSRALGGPVSVELRPVDRIETPRGEKFRWVRTLVATDR